MPRDIDKSINIAPKTRIENSAIGPRAQNNVTYVSKGAIGIVATVILGVVAGLITNAIWGWGPALVSALKGVPHK